MPSACLPHELLVLIITEPSHFRARRSVSLILTPLLWVSGPWSYPGGKSFSLVTTAVLRLITSPLECPSSFSSADNLCRKLEDLQQFQKREPENEEEVDVLNLSEPLQINVKKEQEEKQEEMKFYLPPTPGAEFIGDITQKVGAAACGDARSQTRCEMLGHSPDKLGLCFPWARS